jgi:hypothetical protein
MGFLSGMLQGANASLIAKKAASDAAFGNGAQLAAHTRASVEQYFTRYGSTQRKFDFHDRGQFYIGYVKTPERSEFLSVILMDAKGCVASSYEPPINAGNDILGLMAKKEFADHVALTFEQAVG